MVTLYPSETYVLVNQTSRRHAPHCLNNDTYCRKNLKCHINCEACVLAKSAVFSDSGLNLTAIKLYIVCPLQWLSEIRPLKFSGDKFIYLCVSSCTMSTPGQDLVSCFEEVHFKNGSDV